MIELDQATQWMQQALGLAVHAQQLGEVPVGACVFHDGVCIGAGWNQPIGTHDPTAHAEIVALRAAGLYLENYRLLDTVLVVTLEPCLMCWGALEHARISHLIYAADDPKLGVFSQGLLGHVPNFSVQSGIMAEAASALLKDFFKQRRMC